MPAATLNCIRKAIERKEKAMEMKDRAKHVAPGEGKALWVAGDLVTFKVVGEDLLRAGGGV